MAISSPKNHGEDTERTSNARARPSKDRLAEQNAVTADERVNEAARRQLIAEAAYYRAERRGFAPGGELEDWLGAEASVDLSLSETRLIVRAMS
jgi:hypothetical protein